jgi:alkylhydroperoxidase family enzyme
MFQDVELLSRIIEKAASDRVAALPRLRPVAFRHIYHDALDTLRATGEPREVKDAAHLVIGRLLGCDWSAPDDTPERGDDEDPEADDDDVPW